MFVLSSCFFQQLICEGLTHLTPGSFTGRLTLNCLYLPPSLSLLPPHGSGARMSFLSCCKCEGSRVRRGLLDSASKKKRQSPHALICLIAALCFAAPSSNHSRVVWVRRENSAALTANPSHRLPQMALHRVDRSVPVSNYYSSRGRFW